MNIHQNQFQRTRYGLGSIETLGLSPNLFAKFLKGISITQVMILSEMERHVNLKLEIKKLKRKLKKLRIQKGKFYYYKKSQLKSLIEKKKEDCKKSRVARPRTHSI